MEQDARADVAIHEERAEAFLAPRRGFQSVLICLEGAETDVLISSGWCFNGLNGNVDMGSGVLEIVLDRIAANQKGQTSQVLCTESHSSTDVSAGVRLIYLRHGGDCCHRWGYMESRLLHIHFRKWNDRGNPHAPMAQEAG